MSPRFQWLRWALSSCSINPMCRLAEGPVPTPQGWQARWSSPQPHASVGSRKSGVQLAMAPVSAWGGSQGWAHRCQALPSGSSLGLRLVLGGRDRGGLTILQVRRPVTEGESQRREAAQPAELGGKAAPGPGAVRGCLAATQDREYQSIPRSWGPQAGRTLIPERVNRAVLTVLVGWPALEGPARGFPPPWISWGTGRSRGTCRFSKTPQPGAQWRRFRERLGRHFI